jgi:hypothetical protein
MFTSSTAESDSPATDPPSSVVRKIFSHSATHRQPIDHAKYEAEAKGLLNQIQATLEKQQLEDIQYELGRITNLIPNLKNCEYMDRVAYLSVAVSALSAEKPNLEFARSVRFETEHLIQRTQRGMFRFVYRLAGSTPLSAILAGLICSIISLLILGTYAAFVHNAFSIDFIGVLPGGKITLFMAIIAAAGSYVSVLSRLGQIAGTREFDPFLMFSTGFFKPWIGIAFAFFMLCVFESGIIQIAATVPSQGGTGGAPTTSIVGSGATVDVAAAKHYLYFALAFLSGFSERLVSDFITRAETQIIGPAQPPPTRPLDVQKPPS